MSTTNPTVTTITLPVAQNPTVDFTKLIKKYIFHWPLFLVTLIVFLVGSYFYIKYAKPIYPINSTLEFKNDVSTTNGAQPDKTGIQELDQISSPIIVENEIEVMQSKKIMYQVVNQLKLWVNYSIKDGLLSNDLYKSSPVDFEFIKQAGPIGPQGEKFQIAVKDREHFVLIDENTKAQHLYKFGEPIKSSFGTWQLNATANIDNSYFGKVINVTVMDPDAVTDNYLSALKVSLENKDAPFVNLSISDAVPQRGKDILNSVMAIYNKNAMADKNRKSQATIDFIDKRLDSLNKNLISNEKIIAQYRSAEGIANIDQQTETDLAAQQQNARQLNDLNLQIQTVEEIQNYISSSQNQQGMPSTGNLTDPGLNSMLEKLSDLQLRKDQLLETTPEKNPIFDPINRQIATLKTSIKAKVTTLKSQLLAQREQLENVGSNFKATISRVPQLQSTNNSMGRDQDIREKLYSFLLEKREQISLRYSSAIPDAEIVDDAHAGKAKWPKPAIIYVLAGLLGLGLPIGLIYTRDSFDVKITTRKQIEDVVSIPILGELSYQESSTPIVISQERGKFAIGEQFRVLRTNLYHVHSTNNSGRVTLFTSSTGGEGKSFVSANLAVTLAYASRKTVILEMDLRKPKISLTFGLPLEGKLGISDYLNEDCDDINKLIQSSGISGLDVLGCGSILPNPSELLEKERLHTLIKELRKMYDDVIIDSPPIHLVTDALIIAPVADVTLYIMRQGYTQKAELDFINEIKSEERFNKLNIIFNGIKRDKYGYGYNYDNSYYNTYTNRPKNTFKSAMKKFASRF